MPVCKYRLKAAAAAALLQAQTGLIFAAHTQREHWAGIINTGSYYVEVKCLDEEILDFFSLDRGTKLGKLPVESFVDEKAFFLFLIY